MRIVCSFREVVMARDLNNYCVYICRRKLGEGSFGEVWRATAEGLLGKPGKQMVAVKMLKGSNAQIPVFYMIFNIWFVTPKSCYWFPLAVSFLYCTIRFLLSLSMFIISIMFCLQMNTIFDCIKYVLQYSNL